MNYREIQTSHKRSAAGDGAVPILLTETRVLEPAKVIRREQYSGCLGGVWNLLSGFVVWAIDVFEGAFYGEETVEVVHPGLYKYRYFTVELDPLGGGSLRIREVKEPVEAPLNFEIMVDEKDAPRESLRVGEEVKMSEDKLEHLLTLIRDRLSGEERDEDEEDDHMGGANVEREEHGGAGDGAPDSGAREEGHLGKTTAVDPGL